MAGATLSANASAPAVWFALAIARASASLGLPRACPRALAAARAANVRSLINLALALGEGRVQVQHERLDVRPSSATRLSFAGESQLFVTATQSISISNGPVHSGTQKKIRAGGFLGK
jgi:hypothetical protein